MTNSSDYIFPEAYQPAQIAEKTAQTGVAKAKGEALTLLVLAVLAGAYISLGALFYTVVISGGESVTGLVRFAGGLCFSLGLIMVVVGGAELFTGNNLMAMAWASRLITTRAVIRNWAWVYAGNVLGCMCTVGLVYLAGSGSLLNGEVQQTLIKIMESKAGLSITEAIARGILCNTLVCMAVWLAMAGRSVTDKILAILFPISGFVAMGFEHSIANWFFLPLGMLCADNPSIYLWSSAHNLLWVTLGNIIGGTLLVSAVYWTAYLRKKQ
jgi:formate/nitrite transporter